MNMSADVHYTVMSAVTLAEACPSYIEARREAGNELHQGKDVSREHRRAWLGG
jgi:hypothetical protein